jgi:hypothetical protein
MKALTLESQAVSLEAARAELRNKLPTGHITVEETILCDGAQQTVEAEGADVAEAGRNAKAKVPTGATIQKQEVLREPKVETRAIMAFDEVTARQKVGLARSQTIQSVKMTKAGRRGFLGILRRPANFTAIVNDSAQVRITYRPLAQIRISACTAAAIPSMKSTFWDNGGPIRREGLFGEQEFALSVLAAFARAGNAIAAEEIDSIVGKATETLLDVGEFSSYHGYQRQQAAADILGIAGRLESVATLNAAHSLQEEYAGCSQYSNRTSTKPLVQRSIEKALNRLKHK